MEKEIQEMVDELNKLNSSQYSNLYEFILCNSSIKKEKSDITEDEIRKIPSIKLKELLVEMELKIKSLKKNISNEEQIKSLEKVLEIGIDIFSSDENRKLYEKMEQSRTVLSADSISSFKKSDFEKYQKYIDNFWMLIAPEPIEKIKCSACSFDNNIVFTFTSILDDCSIENEFYKFLKQKNINVLKERKEKLMVNMDEILELVVKKDASDVHLICGNKPVLRIARELTVVDEMEVLTPEDMNEIYDYLIRGNLDKDSVFRETRKLDTSYEFKNVRFRVNISNSFDIPVYTLRLIKNELPTFEELGVPDVVRRMTYQTQGLILVTGKTNSGKTTTLNALINEINETQNRKIMTLENPVEYRHHSKKSLIVQKEVGKGQDSLTFSDGVKNSLREDCDILVIGEIRDKVTMEAAIEMAESGHLVIGTLHTKSCAETIDRMINFYEVRDQASIKYLLSALLKLVVSQRLLKGKDGKLVLIPEVMVVDNIVAGIIRKEKISVSEIEDAIQSNLEKGSIGLINSLAEAFVNDKITLDQAKAQIEEKNIETLNRTIMQLKIRQGK